MARNQGKLPKARASSAGMIPTLSDLLALAAFAAGVWLLLSANKAR